MSKKVSKKTAAVAAPAQGESFLDDAAAPAAAQAAPTATKAKRVYKPRSGKSSVKPSAIQAAYELGCKHTAARMELGA